ncbi:TIGR04290 family methyltransferase [Enhygromyxa salina]|uniref:tRNA (Mo5U34)-methyltransferase n=1 Tax=Enhygromyxa salina TaxID=215803 RepID=A0A2S9XTT0_9BACT|nr:TIGR04290 family methyltransferase [Enhygromyxa salina]PRP96253.1 tRNA (mo5U34)-methyltransferase [Enhygromyxa salina]
MSPETLQSSGARASGPLEHEIRQRGPWFHNLHLPDGSRTAPDHPLGDFPAYKWRQLEASLPADLSGTTALDIGCNAGFYSFELARRGAQVDAVDVDEHYLEQARWARGQLGLDAQVCLFPSSVYHLARRDVTYDLVLFMGLFYHLRYPLLALDIVARRCADTLIFQSLSLPDAAEPARTSGLRWQERQLMTRPGWPSMAFIEHDLAGDATNWWVPNHAAIEAMLRTVGFRVDARPGHELYVCRRDPALTQAARWLDDEYRAACGLE